MIVLFPLLKKNNEYMKGLLKDKITAYYYGPILLSSKVLRELTRHNESCQSNWTEGIEALMAKLNSLTMNFIRVLKDVFE